jgi:hypothetical protein
MAYPTILTVLNNVPAEQQFQGPYVFGGVRFFFGFKVGSGNLTVARSADFGVTWTEADAANSRPVGSTIFTIAACPDAAYPATPKIYVVFLQTATDLFRLATFDVSTETWDVADIQSTLGYDAGPPSPNTDDNSWFISHRAVDNMVIMFVSSVLLGGLPGGRWRCQYAKCDLTGAAWDGAYTQVGTAGTEAREYFSRGSIAGDSGLTHFFYSKSSDFTPPNPPPPTKELMHVSLTSGGVLSAPQTLYDEFTSAGFFRRTSNPISRIESGSLALYLPFRFLDLSVTPNQYVVRLFKGLSVALPVWSDISISSGDQLPTNPKTTLGPVCLFDDNGTLVAMWGLNSFSGSGAVTSAVLRQSLSADGVTWAADTLFYTGPANHSISPTNIGGAQVGTFGFAAHFSDGVDDILDYWDSDAPSTLAIECDNPPVGIVGTLYVHEFPASSGTPPYEFLVTFGSLPPGLTLDPVTGIVSGTPTGNGTFPFTIQVTDALDATAEVECSITIQKRCMLVEVR